MNKYAGLFAAVTNVTEPSNSDLNTLPDYVSAAGIQEIASQTVSNELFKICLKFQNYRFNPTTSSLPMALFLSSYTPLLDHMV